jgi:enoyl-CoA hydratase/carnithine racemase
MTDLIKVVRAEGVLSLTFNRPDKKNAITDDMYRILADELGAAENDNSVRAILIRGEGEHFTSGNDVSEFAAAAVSGLGLENVGRFIFALADATKPLVAAVQGRAVGIGTTLLLHCDHVVLSADAELSTPFVNLALVPEAGSTLLLPERIGHSRAFTMFALGDVVGASQALAWGLANKVVDVAELDAAAHSVAARLAQQPLGSLVATKHLMRAPARISGRMEAENKAFGLRLKSAEAREAFTAFAQRRAPNFSQVA